MTLQRETKACGTARPYIKQRKNILTLRIAACDPKCAILEATAGTAELVAQGNVVAVRTCISLLSRQVPGLVRIKVDYAYS